MPFDLRQSNRLDVDELVLPLTEGFPSLDGEVKASRVG